MTARSQFALFGIYSSRVYVHGKKGLMVAVYALKTVFSRPSAPRVDRRICGEFRTVGGTRQLSRIFRWRKPLICTLNVRATLRPRDTRAEKSNPFRPSRSCPDRSRSLRALPPPHTRTRAAGPRPSMSRAC